MPVYTSLNIHIHLISTQVWLSLFFGLSPSLSLLALPLSTYMFFPLYICIKTHARRRIYMNVCHLLPGVRSLSASWFPSISNCCRCLFLSVCLALSLARTHTSIFTHTLTHKLPLSHIHTSARYKRVVRSSHTHTHTHTHNAPAYTNTQTYTYRNTHAHIHIHVHRYRRSDIRSCTGSTNRFTYTNTNTYTHIHIHIHRYKRSDVRSCTGSTNRFTYTNTHTHTHTHIHIHRYRRSDVRSCTGSTNRLPAHLVQLSKVSPTVIVCSTLHKKTHFLRNITGPTKSCRPSKSFSSPP